MSSSPDESVSHARLYERAMNIGTEKVSLAIGTKKRSDTSTMPRKA